ncbi:helix-turn-helix domain-containing protein [uncultured Neptuniibacter sp.]|uniref:helix-turn-helix domain-containing protein n=1 Tax=uncultured Neptuniibacter sp. TaxID=502143 RepID=UPI0026095A81|nr:AraC family transcriptional regulator [uncultured Neptuniibacter sp.]
MNVDKQEGLVCSQQVAVVAAGQEHGFSANDKNIFIVADVPEALAPDLERLPAFISIDPALTQYVFFLHQQLITDSCSQTSERQMLLLLIQLLQERYGEELRLDRRIEATRTYLDQHYCKPVSLAQLSIIANLSSRQLSELFKRQLGMTPQQYLTEKRMQKAWQLLESSALSVQQIADQVGYQNLASFSDRFRKHFGHSPSYFRKIGK